MTLFLSGQAKNFVTASGSLTLKGTLGGFGVSALYGLDDAGYD
jgi:hypothetical protein